MHTVTARAALALTSLSLGLLGATAVAFTRQRRAVMVACGALFVPVVAAATLAAWWPVSPVLAVCLLAGTLGVSLVTLVLYAVDWLFAVFALEMTYPALLCWVLWPVLVAADFLVLAAA
jgi:hypothetical protein